MESMRIHANLPTRKKKYKAMPTLELARQLDMASICSPVQNGPVNEIQMHIYGGLLFRESMQIYGEPNVPRIHANPWRA